jgi:hypothetical protein
MELTSSPRSFPSLSWVLKVPSSAHLAQISSSALAKSSAGGKELMVEFCFAPAYYAVSYPVGGQSEKKNEAKIKIENKK